VRELIVVALLQELQSQLPPVAHQLLEDVDSPGPVGEVFQRLYAQLLHFLRMSLQVPGTKTNIKTGMETLPLSMAWTTEGAVVVAILEVIEVNANATGKGTERETENATVIGIGIGSVTGKAIETEKGKGNGNELERGRPAPSWKIEVLLGNGGVRLDWRMHVQLNGADLGRDYIALYKPYLVPLFVLLS